MVLVGYVVINQAVTIYQIIKVKQRKKQRLLPDYKQIELLQISLNEGSTMHVFISKDKTDKEKLQELNKYINGEKFDEAWAIVDEMINGYERLWFAILLTTIVIAVVILILK